MGKDPSPQVGPAAGGPPSPWAPPRGQQQPPMTAPPAGGSTAVIPPQPPTSPYQPPLPPPAEASEQSPKLVWLLSGTAVVLAIAAVVMGALAWTRPDPAPITTTITPSAPTYSDKEV